jgi:hypothetical protein
MAELSERVIRQIGLDSITFNIEYFWDPEHDTITLLGGEPTPFPVARRAFRAGRRHRQPRPHAATGSGPQPRPRHRKGPYDMAAKWFVRRVADGVARRVPTGEEVEQVQRDIPGCTIDVSITAGDRLSNCTIRTATATHSRPSTSEQPTRTN